MSTKTNEFQIEMFEEFKNKTDNINKKVKKTIQEDKLLSIEFLKDIRIELSLDIIAIACISFILFSITMYFFGIQSGKKIRDKKLIQENKELQEVIQKQDSRIPVVVTRTAPVDKKKNKEDKQPKKTLQKTNNVLKPEKTAVKQTLTEQKNILPNSQAITEKKEKYKYTIQTASSIDEEAAIKLVQKLSEKGYSAFLTRTSSSSGKTWYKICIGKFTKSNQAAPLLKKLKTKEKYKDCFLTHI